MANVPLFSKGVHEYISYAGYFVFIFKGAQYFSYCWVIFLYSQKVFSISHMLGIFSIFSKGAQYLLYPYRWVIFLYFPIKPPSISHVKWFVDC